MPSPHDQIQPNFLRGEFEEEGYHVRIHPKIPATCQMVRTALGAPLYITSGVRSPQRNSQVGGSPNSSHLLGLACDISTNNVGATMGPHHRYTIINALLSWGIKRIGIAQTFIHFDIDESKTQGIIWLY